MPTGKKGKFLYEKERSPYWWYRFTIEGREYRGSTQCTDAKAAADYVEALRVEVRSDIAANRAALGQVRGGRRQITLCACLDIFEAEKGRNWKTLRDKRRYAEYLLNLGDGPDMLLSDLSLAHLAKYRVQRTMMTTGSRENPRPVSDATVNREIAHIQAAVNHLRGRGFELPEIRWGDAKEHSAEVKRVRCLTADEESRLMAALQKRKPDLIPLVLFSIMCGQRKSATINLRWDRVDLDAMVATVELKGKGKRPRFHQFPLTDAAAALIKAQPKVAGCEQVFTYSCEKDTVSRGGEWRYAGKRYPFTQAGWTKAWKAALKLAGIEDFRFHDLRHTCATRLVRSTGNLQLAKNLLGHEQIQTTDRYANQDLSDLRRAMEVTEDGAKLRLVG